MADRINVQVVFKKFWWTCPVCGQEDIEDANVGGGNTYEHDCSKCAAHFNQSGNNMREYNNSVTMLKADYDLSTVNSITDKKTAMFEKWVYEVKNPKPYVEPTVEVLEQLKAEKQAEIDALQAQIDAKGK